MPELPEVEVLARHLALRLAAKPLRNVRVLDRRALWDSTPRTFKAALRNRRFQQVQRRGKYLCFTLKRRRQTALLIAHLGMTGRVFLADASAPTSRHTRVVIGLGTEKLVFEDVRRFGGLSLDSSVLDRLGPEPLEPGFTVGWLGLALANSRQSIKAKLLDQSVAAGIGNIYASEALFLARIDPRTPSNQLDRSAIKRLRSTIRRVLAQAIRFGSSIPLSFSSNTSSNKLFYYGQPRGDLARYEERLRVYDREGEHCRRCGTDIQRMVLGGRSTFFCPVCQRPHSSDHGKVPVPIGPAHGP